MGDLSLTRGKIPIPLHFATWPSTTSTDLLSNRLQIVVNSDCLFMFLKSVTLNRTAPTVMTTMTVVTTTVTVMPITLVGYGLTGVGDELTGCCAKDKINTAYSILSLRGPFITSESEHESEKGQRTSKRDQRHQSKFFFLFRFRTWMVPHSMIHPWTSRIWPA